MVAPVFERGWQVFPAEPAVTDWVDHAIPAAHAALADPVLADQLDCDGTWFVGVDALANDAQGRLGDGPPLAGTALDLIRQTMGPIPKLHRAQLSVTFPGYPRPRRGETDAGFRYRLNRDAAHMDGLLPIGPTRRRKVREPHMFILGLPLSKADTGAAPLVVWEGSHDIMRAALAPLFRNRARHELQDIDVTDAYQEARRKAFDSCKRQVITAEPGMTILVHRLALHGVGPWTPGALAEDDRRMIAYFRPEMPGGVADWITAP